MNSYATLQSSRHIKYGLRAIRCQTQHWRADTKILVTANGLHTNQGQNTSLNCAIHPSISFRISRSTRSLNGRNLFSAFTEIKESTEPETQSQLYVCCTLEQKHKSPRQPPTPPRHAVQWQLCLSHVPSDKVPSSPDICQPAASSASRERKPVA